MGIYFHPLIHPRKKNSTAGWPGKKTQRKLINGPSLRQFCKVPENTPSWLPDYRRPDLSLDLWVIVLYLLYRINSWGEEKCICTVVCSISDYFLTMTWLTGLQQKRVYTSLGSSCPTCVHQSPWQSRENTHYVGMDNSLIFFSTLVYALGTGRT